MKVYHGCSITNLLKLIEQSGYLYVTDTAERAARYANAQASGRVSAKYTPLAEGAAVAEIESAPVNWSRRPESHNSLDTCEAVTSEWRVMRVTIHPRKYENTLYGWRGNLMKIEQIIARLEAAGVEVEMQ